MPVPETNGEEWDRLEPASALDALVELVLHGEYNGLDSVKRLKDGLELRATASILFEVRPAYLFFEHRLTSCRTLSTMTRSRLQYSRPCYQQVRAPK
jgi:hypothetical protein